VPIAIAVAVTKSFRWLD